MAICASASVPDYVVDAQNCFQGGRVVAVAFIDVSVTFTDITDPTEWTAAVTAGDILLHTAVRGSYPRASTTEQPGLGSQDVRPVGGQHQIQFRENGLKGNHAYWNPLRTSNNYKLAFVVGGDYDHLFYVNKVVSIDGRPVVDEALDTEANYDVIVKWSDINNPEITDVPAGIFTA